MKIEDIKEIIAEELKEYLDLSNIYGLDLDKCLIEPIKQTYISSVDENVKYDFWTVLEETVDKTGYKITFDEDDKEFGLGMLSDKNELVDIGTFGRFLDALKGM